MNIQDYLISLKKKELDLKKTDMAKMRMNQTILNV